MQKARRRAARKGNAPTACKRTVSGSLSLPSQGFFPPFPHGTGSLSVFRMYLALRDGPRSFGQDSSCPGLLRFRLAAEPLARTGVSPSAPALPSAFRFALQPLLRRPYNPARAATPAVWAPPPSLAATEGIEFSFFSCGY